MWYLVLSATGHRIWEVLTWQAKLELGRGYGIGLDGLGKIENLGASPSLSQQDHRTGPALYFTTELSKGHEITIDIGALVGLTPEAPGTTLKVNAEVPLSGK